MKGESGEGSIVEKLGGVAVGLSGWDTPGIDSSHLS